MRKFAAYLFLLFVLTLPLSLGWILNMAAGNPAPSTNPHPTITFDLPPVSVTLGDGAVATVRATLVLHSSAQGPKVTAAAAKLLDAVSAQLRELPSGETERQKALAGLHDKLKARLNGVLAPEKLDDVLLKEVTVR